MHLIVYSGNMEAMRQSWTDDRLDDFRGEVNRRFDEVDRRFDDLSRQMDAMNARFDSFQRAMFQAAVAPTTAILTVAAAIVATQL